jgi:NAD(P)-dependent dehydrogenase (short-subunit alcohol dehydrogenase family)
MSTSGLQDRVVIVTGAGNGLGRSHALQLAADGAAVVVNDPGRALDGTGSSAAPAEAVVEEIRSRGGIAEPNFDSVTDPDGRSRLINTALEVFGGLHGLVNNAGILRDRSYHNMAPDEIDLVLDVHLTGALHLTQMAYRHMRTQSDGNIVFTTSASGLYGNYGQANYAAGKAGLIGLLKTLAIEGAPRGVRVNAVAPIASTRMTEGMNGVGEQTPASAVSAVVALMMDPDCQIISVSGRRLAEVFIGETRGVVLDAVDRQGILNSLPDISKRDGYVEPGSLQDAMQFISDRLDNGT